MSKRVREPEEEEEEPSGPLEGSPQRGFALSFLALLPLLLLYEWSASTAGGGLRNTSELLLVRPLASLLPFDGISEVALRRVLLAGVAIACFVHVWRSRRAAASEEIDEGDEGGAKPLGPIFLRIGIEGVVGAMALGPALLGVLALLPASVPPIVLRAGPPAVLPDLHAASWLAGSAAYEELVFRVGCYSLIFLLARASATFAGLPIGAARLTADLVALVGSSVLFAAFHLAPFVSLVGSGGEEPNASVFAWRTLAGALLALVFRWRGAAVAGWTHGLFNVAMVLGAGPGVFR